VYTVFSSADLCILETCIFLKVRIASAKARTFGLGAPGALYIAMHAFSSVFGRLRCWLMDVEYIFTVLMQAPIAPLL